MPSGQQKTLPEGTVAVIMKPGLTWEPVAAGRPVNWNTPSGSPGTSTRVPRLQKPVVPEKNETPIEAPVPPGSLSPLAFVA